MTNSDRSPTANRRAVLAKGALLGAGALGTTVGAAAPASAETDRYARGLAALRRISGERGTQVIESLRDIAPDLGRYIVEFAFGDIYLRRFLVGSGRV